MNNLLIVDDEWIIRDSLRNLIEWKSKDICVSGTAANGKEALEFIERESVDIVITDIQMPDMNGLELLESIYLLDPNIDVIMISGHEQFQYAHTALKYKARGYILKPIDTDELFDLVDDILLKKNRTKAFIPTTIEVVEPPKNYHETLIAQAKIYIAINFQQPLTLNDVANQFFLNPHYFGQLFKAIQNENFTTYLTRLRMEKASELLKKPELKTYEVSGQIGYSDVKYFARMFYRHFQMTPRDYRQHYFSGNLQK